MRKNTILIVNPVSKNMMRAIYNATMIKLLDIIILGNKDIIGRLCIELNMNIQLLQIVGYKDNEDLKNKLQKYKSIKEIKGVIFDTLQDKSISYFLKCKSICQIIDYGIFKKSIYLIPNAFSIIQFNKINETIKILNSLNIPIINIGIINSERKKSLKIKKEIECKVKVNSIQIIPEWKIKKCKYNIILFDNKIEEEKYLNRINNNLIQRIIEVKKASNILVFDAKDKETKNIFFQFLFLSKLDILVNEFNTKII